MNHLTPAEAFRRRLRAMSRPQLEEAMLVLRQHDEYAVDRALEFAATPFTAPAGPPAPVDERVIEFMRCRLEHVVLNDAAPNDPLTVDCPDCGAAAGDRCWTAFGCMARFSAAQVAS